MLRLPPRSTRVRSSAASDVYKRQPDECVDCGACEPVCPVEAIFYEDDVPSQWTDYTPANVEFFGDVTGLGSPGGASKVGLVAKDHPLVTALPPQGEDA